MNTNNRWSYTVRVGDKQITCSSRREVKKALHSIIEDLEIVIDTTDNKNKTVNHFDVSYSMARTGFEEFKSFYSEKEDHSKQVWEEEAKPMIEVLTQKWRNKWLVKSIYSYAGAHGYC